MEQCGADVFPDNPEWGIKCNLEKGHSGEGHARIELGGEFDDEPIPYRIPEFDPTVLAVGGDPLSNTPWADEDFTPPYSPE